MNLFLLDRKVRQQPLVKQTHISGNKLTILAETGVEYAFVIDVFGVIRDAHTGQKFVVEEIKRLLTE